MSQDEAAENLRQSARALGRFGLVAAAVAIVLALFDVLSTTGAGVVAWIGAGLWMVSRFVVGYYLNRRG